MSYDQRWQILWRRFGVAPADRALLQSLLDQYALPQRRYHTLQHLDACLAHFDRSRASAQQPEEVELALWFHDAVYEVGSPGNERSSADWARAALLQAGASAEAAQRVHALVMATSHQVAPQTADQALLLDIDLAILGSPPAQFDRYEQQVREEYAAVPEPAFRTGRRRLLAQFLALPRIYRTAAFNADFELQARANLSRSIARLGGD